MSSRKPAVRAAGAWAFQMNWQSFSRAATSMANSLTLGASEVSVLKYRASPRARCATSGALSITEPGPPAGMPPRSRTIASNAAL